MQPDFDNVTGQTGELRFEAHREGQGRKQFARQPHPEYLSRQVHGAHQVAARSIERTVGLRFSSYVSWLVAHFQIAFTDQADLVTAQLRAFVSPRTMQAHRN